MSADTWDGHQPAANEVLDIRYGVFDVGRDLGLGRLSQSALLPAKTDHATAASDARQKMLPLVCVVPVYGTSRARAQRGAGSSPFPRGRCAENSMRKVLTGSRCRASCHSRSLAGGGLIVNHIDAALACDRNDTVLAAQIQTPRKSHSPLCLPGQGQCCQNAQESLQTIMRIIHCGHAVSPHTARGCGWLEGDTSSHLLLFPCTLTFSLSLVQNPCLVERSFSPLFPMRAFQNTRFASSRTEGQPSNRRRFR